METPLILAFSCDILYMGTVLFVMAVRKRRDVYNQCLVSGVAVEQTLAPTHFKVFSKAERPNYA